MKHIYIIILLLLWINNTYSQESYSNIIDVQHYNIVLDFTDMDNSRIKGHTEVNLKLVNENTNIVKLDLLKLEIDSITCIQSGLSYNYNDTTISISLSGHFSAEDIIGIKVYYHGTPLIDPSGFGGFYFSGGYAFNMGVGILDIPHNYGKTWFPCNDDFTDRASYKFTITTKPEHTAVCNGELLSVTENTENNVKTFEWQLHETIPTYLASVSVGPYFCYESSYNGQNGEIPVSIYVYPGDSAKTAQSFANLNSALSIFENKFGPYKWNRIGYVAIPFNGGAMEHATNIAIGRSYINGSLTYEDLFYHELAHHWFGDLITCSSAEDMWLNEGWATYCETIFREFMYSRENALTYRRNSHLSVIKDFNVTEGGFHALYPMDQSLTYSSTVYEKGGSVTHALRGYIGDDIFFPAIKEFLQRNSYSAVSSYNLRDFLTEYTGIDMTDFFNDWVFTGGFVHYSIDSACITKLNNDYEITVYMKQKLRGRTNFANSNRVEVSFLDRNFNVITKIMEFDGEYGEQTFLIPFEPILILCDYNEVLSDATTDISKIFTTPQNSVNYTSTYFKTNIISAVEEEPALLRITHNFVAPDKLKENIPGLIIADHRYWTVEGNFPDSFRANGEFSYDNSSRSYLDNNFITNSLDSLVLLYRNDRSGNWEILNAANIKLSKKFTVDTLRAGEYSLGIFDWEKYINTNSINSASFCDNITIFPNPNNGNFLINTENTFKGNINIYNIYGQMVFQKKYDDYSNNIKIETNNLKPGLYILELRDIANNKLINKKIIIQN
ncbi:MAG: T9SS type A sorting domain-containing protein [Bacteroidales bacterium]|jgi:aminopeptidase N|nr:T9SS type A sorting domain-containing protein [Bacteroidales bacterium]